MKRLIKFGSLGLVIAGAIASVSEVGAQTLPPLFRQIGGTTLNLGVSGTPNTTKSVTVSNIPGFTFTTLRVNDCGFVKITNPSAFTEGAFSVRQGSSTINSFIVATVKASAAIPEPTCVNGVAAGIPSTGNSFNVGRGAIVVTGLPVSRVLDARYEDLSPVTTIVTMNACGYGTLPYRGGTVSVDGGASTTENLILSARYSCSSGILSQLRFADGGSNVPEPTIQPISRDPLNNVIFKRTLSSSFPVAIAGQTFTRSATSDRCGGLYLGSTTSPVSGVVTINGVATDINNLPLETVLETCTLRPNGTYNRNQFYGSARYANGRAYIYPSGGFGNRSILSVQTVGNRNVNPIPNSCLTAVVRGTTTSPLTPSTTITVDGTTTAISALPLLNAIPSCNATTSQLTFRLTP